MTTPDLVSLRALVEAAIRLDQAIYSLKRESELHADEIALHGALPAAREALERVEIQRIDDAEEIVTLRDRLARLESALLKYGQHSPRCPVWATMTRGTCTCGLDAALEGRDV